MAIGLKLRSVAKLLGSASFVHSFFATIAGNLEPEGWGSRFPTLMVKLYGEGLAEDDAVLAVEELATIRAELSEIGPEKVIWDYDDRSKRPPWGDDIASSITSLGDYFVTSGGEDLIEEMDKVLRRQAQTGGMAKFVTL